MADARFELLLLAVSITEGDRAPVFDFADGRGDQHARAFPGLRGEDGWRGTLVCDDFNGYKACFELGVTEAGCLAHARIERLGCTFAHQGAEEVVAREQVEVWLEAVRVAVRDRGPLPSPGTPIQWHACTDKVDTALIARVALTRRCFG
ncbi:hypothetical protein ABIC89_002404 [Variovorax boronicumulans]